MGRASGPVSSGSCLWAALRTEPRLGKVGDPANASIFLNYLVPGTHLAKNYSKQAVMGLRLPRKS